MNNKDKYTVSKLADAIDDAMNVSFNQMVDTVKTQCYMSQTETNWEDCEELEYLREHRKMGNAFNTITNEMKRVVISALTDSDWVGDDDKKSSETWFVTNDSENSVIILALETLLEQVRDARDFEQIARVKNLLDDWKNIRK